MGDLVFGPGDYLVVPRGVLHRYRFSPHPVRCLVIESRGYVRTPKRYRNEHGQLTESAPFSERDIRRPGRLQTVDERGEFPIVVKKDHRLTEFTLDHHPFDVVGWDGYYYPWAFNIHDFEPRVGRVHLPPPVHQTFEGDGFGICSFSPIAMALSAAIRNGAMYTGSTVSLKSLRPNRRRQISQLSAGMS